MPNRIFGNASRNSSWLLLGQASGVGVSLLFALCAARILGAAAFGQYAYAVALTSFLTLGASLGLDILLVRTLARDFSRARDEFTAAVALRSILWLAGMGALALIVRSVRCSDGARDATLILGLSVLPVLLTGCATAVMAAQEHMGRVALIQTGSIALRVACGLIALVAGQGVVGIAWATVIASCAALLAALLVLARRYEMRLVSISPSDAWKIGRRAAPFGVASLLFTLYFRFNIVFLGSWNGDSEVGLYAIAFKFVDAYIMIPGAILAACFPILSRLHGQTDGSFGACCRFLSRWLLLIGIPIAALIGAVSEELLVWLFGSEYAGAATALAIVAWLAPLLGLNSVFGNALFAAGRPGEVLRTELVGVVIALGSALLLLPTWGATGGAIGIVTTEIAVVSRNAWALRREPGVLPSWSVIIPGLPAALLASLVAARLPLPVPLALLGGGLVYIVLFHFAGGIRSDERSWLSSNLPPGRLRALCRFLRLLRPAIEENPTGQRAKIGVQQ